jgi:hypothetical protein
MNSLEEVASPKQSVKILRSYEDKLELTSRPLNMQYMTILVKFKKGQPFRK